MRLWPQLVAWMFRLLCLPPCTRFIYAVSHSGLTLSSFSSSSLFQQPELSCFWKCAGAAALFSRKEAATRVIETNTEIVLCSCLSFTTCSLFMCLSSKPPVCCLETLKPVWPLLLRRDSFRAVSLWNLPHAPSLSCLFLPRFNWCQNQQQAWANTVNMPLLG